GFISTTMPFLLSKGGVPVHQIANCGAITWSPFFLSFLWAPLVDLGWKRRTIVALSGLTTAALLASAATLLGPRNLVAFTALASLATASSTFTCAATGSLMATLVPEPQRGGAGGWYMVGTLAGAALTSGITMSVYERFGTASAALVLAGLAGLPSLGSLVLRESELVTVGV